MNPAADVWSKVITLMQPDMTATTINTWFDDASAVALEDDRFVLYSPTRFKRDIIATRYVGKIQAALRELFSCDMDVVVLTEGELDQYSQPEKDNFFPGTEEYTFERFVVGSSNKFAHAAARAVAEAVGADKLIFLTDTDGILVDSHNQSTRIAKMDVSRAKELMDSGLIAGGMIPKTLNCIHAVEHGVGSVTVLDGRMEHAILLEAISEKSLGTTMEKKR